jgi:hypothetical protein
MSDTVQTILFQIGNGTIALPTFQRGYVWNREQVRGLMQSVYRRYPIGSLLVWKTEIDPAYVKAGGGNATGTVHLLLDGQQRMTTLFGIVYGAAPPFFEGDTKVFTGLHFHLEDEVFEFYAPVKMRDDPLWVNVSEVMKIGPVAAAQPFFGGNVPQDVIQRYLDRLNGLDRIKSVELYTETVTGIDKTVDVVVDIFNRVNSGGTKLSKGDLALARICSHAPEARDMMRERLATWGKGGFWFSLDWLLRHVNTILTGEANFSALSEVTPDEFFDGLARAEKTCNYLLNMVSARLGLDHDRVLAGRNAFPVMSAYVDRMGGKLPSSQHRDRLLYWYIQSFLWGRFTGSTETAMNQDLKAIQAATDPIEGLVEQLRQTRGSLRIRPEDFSGYSVGARFYPLLYLLSRVYGARDFGTGNPLKAELLGKGSALQVHHIFPRAVLYEAGYNRGEVNAVANFCLLTQETNAWLSDTPPEKYFPKVLKPHPGAMESQWIPLDPNLRQIDRYRDFLEARRKLLADAANSFLDELLTGMSAQADIDYSTNAAPMAVSVQDEIDSELLELLSWCDEHDIPKPLVEQELSDPTTHEVLTLADATWPLGVQSEYSDPIALVRETVIQNEARLQELGYRLFHNITDLQKFLLMSLSHSTTEPIEAVT